MAKLDLPITLQHHPVVLEEQARWAADIQLRIADWILKAASAFSAGELDPRYGALVGFIDSHRDRFGVELVAVSTSSDVGGSTPAAGQADGATVMAGAVQGRQYREREP
jgi:hypothetical protein